MDLNKEFAYIDDYFSNISKEELIQELINCGLGKITSSEDFGAVPFCAITIYNPTYTPTANVEPQYEEINNCYDFSKAA